MMSTNNNPVNICKPASDKTGNFKDVLLRIYLYFEIVLLSTLLTFKGFFCSFLPQKPKSLKNQVALITGSGNGLGRQIALSLANEGCHIAVVDVDLKGAEETVSLAKKFNVNAKAYKTDVSSLEQIQVLKEWVEKDLGPVDILVNNAAILDGIKPFYTKPSDIERILKVNVLHHFWTIQTFLKGMIERKKGHIVGICSVICFTPTMPGGYSYTAGKFANYGFMKSLTSTLVRNKQDYIKTTTVHPYIMATRADFVTEIQKYRACELFPLARPSQVANDTVKAIKKNQRNVFSPSYLKRICYMFYLSSTYFQDYIRKLLTQMY